MNVNLCIDDKIVISIQDSIYSSAVVHKCFYWYAHKFDIDIEKSNDSYKITLTNIPKDYDIKTLLSRIRKDLIDYNTREIINKETQDIRTLLVAKAFSNIDDFDEPPAGDLNDPIGFKPSDFR